MEAAEKPGCEPPVATLDEVVLASALADRSPRQSVFSRETEAFQRLAQCMADDPDRLLDTLSSISLELCHGGSAGVSLLDTAPDGKEVFRWVTLAGAAAPHVGGTTPREWSPCGTCLARGSATLFSHPERHFTYFQRLGLPIVEGLVVPLRRKGEDIGTIWVMTHTDEHHFDAEDVRLLEGLGAFTSAAVSLNEARRQAEESARFRGERAALVEWSTDAILCISAEGVITDWNPAANGIFGYSSEEALGRHLTFLGAPERVGDFEHLLSHIRRGKAVRELTTEAVRKDGMRIELEISVQSIVDKKGRTAAAVAVARDVTKRRQSQSAAQYLAAIVESSDDAIISKDLQGIIRTWNKGAERIFGYAAHEIVGKPVTVLAAPDRVHELPRILARIRSGERVEHYETRRRTKDGRVLDISLTVSPIRDASGAIIGASKIARDITERKRIEEDLRAWGEALRESESRYRLAVRAANSVIWDWHVPSRQVVWSELLQPVFGYAPETIGTDIEESLAWWTERLHPEDRADVAGGFRQLAASDALGWSKEYRFQRADGSWAHVLDQCYVERDAEGRLLRVIGSILDVTDRRRAEEELRTANEELKAANRELEQFAYVASHDLKEPLRMVNSYTQLLLRRMPEQSPELADYAEYIRTGVHRMEALLDDLLAFSRVIHGERHDSAVKLDAVLEETLSVLADTIRETAASVTHDELPVVFGDAVQLGQVLQNLLGNSLKYRNGNAPPQVHIGVQHHGGEWIVSVADNGLGFRPEYADQIFGLFRRLHRHNIPGTGIGLAICRRIVERHGGRIWAESAGEGAGATFRFSLPARGNVRADRKNA